MTGLSTGDVIIFKGECQIYTDAGVLTLIDGVPLGKYVVESFTQKHFPHYSEPSSSGHRAMLIINRVTCRKLRKNGHYNSNGKAVSFDQCASYEIVGKMRRSVHFSKWR